MLTKEQTLELIKKANKVIEKESMLINLESKNKEIIVIGDVHADSNIVNKIIKDFSTENRILIFVGDYVDRALNEGDSIKVLEALFNLKIEFPDRLILLRGNHEFKNVNKRFGFRDEILNIYGNDELWEAWNKLFESLPVAVFINRKILVLHGGIPDIENLEEINNIKKGLQIQESELLDQIVWNDYKPDINEKIYGYRGLKHTFIGDKEHFNKMREKLHFDVLIRGHQPEVKGLKFNNKCITLQTSERFAHHPKNESNLFIHKRGKIIVEIKNELYNIITL